jgi:hypothetical protein
LQRWQRYRKQRRLLNEIPAIRVTGLIVGHDLSDLPILTLPKDIPDFIFVDSQCFASKVMSLVGFGFAAGCEIPS